MRTGKQTRIGRIGLILVLVTALTACSAVYRNHGWTPEDDDMAAIIVGVDDRISVEAQIGKPSANGVLRDDAWYYVSSRVRHWAYRAPQVIEREVLAISFSDDGTVANIERYGLEDGKVINLSRRVTETSITEFGLIQQLIRNIGIIDIGQTLADN